MLLSFLSSIYSPKLLLCMFLLLLLLPMCINTDLSHLPTNITSRLIGFQSRVSFTCLASRLGPHPSTDIHSTMSDDEITNPPPPSLQVEAGGGQASSSNVEVAAAIAAASKA